MKIANNRKSNVATLPINRESFSALDKISKLSKLPNSDISKIASKILECVETNGEVLIVPDSLNELMKAINTIYSPVNNTTPIINFSKYAS